MGVEGNSSPQLDSDSKYRTLFGEGWQTRGWGRWPWGVKGALRRGPGQEHIYLLGVEGKRVKILEVTLLVAWGMSSVSFFGTVAGMGPWG